MRFLAGPFFFVLLSALIHPPADAAEERVAGADDRAALGVTVYTNGLALVRDRRRVDLPEGESRLAFEDVAARMIPASARVGGRDLRVLERDFEFETISAQSLLAAAEGHEVDVVTVDSETGGQTVRRGRVLGTASGPIIEIDGKVWSEPPGILVHDRLPDGLRPRPTLLATLRATADGPRPVDLAYLTEGLDWQADYTVVLTVDGDRLDLDGWATVTNRSGADFPAADLQLVAGSVRRDSSPPTMKMERALMSAAPMADGGMPRRESLAAFHLYDLGRQVTLKDKQSKQVALLSARDIEAARDLVIVSGGLVHGLQRGRQGPIHPAARLTFRNWKDNPGLPLPAGTARIYQPDSKGRLQFVGEDRMPDVPENGEVTLTLGQAFDVTLYREQTAFEWRDRKRRESESAHRLTLANGGDKPAEVRIEETLPGEWSILDESQPHERRANMAVWTVTVPPKGEAVLTYRVTVQP